MAELKPIEGENLPPPLVPPEGLYETPLLGGALRGLDIGQRVGFDIPEGLLGIGLQKGLSAVPGAGRGREEEVVTRAVEDQLATLPEWWRPFAAPVLYAAGASEAKRVSQRRAAETGLIPSVETPIGRFDALNLAEIALPVGGLAELAARAAPKIAGGLAAKGAALAGRDAATTAYRAQEAANRYRELVRQGASHNEALDAASQAFPTVNEGEIVGRALGPANVEAENAAQALRRAQAGDEAAVSFTTEKGSTYVVKPDGTTVRNKAPRPEHPGDFGVQPPSQRTVYVRDPSALAEFQAQGGGTRRIVINDQGGWAGVGYESGPSAGAVERRTVTSFSTMPTVGATPIEIWDDGRRVHFGNKITDVRSGAHVASPGPGEPIPGAVGPNVGEALARAKAAKELRTRGVLGRIMRGENVRADEAADALEYLKRMNPAGAVEYDRMLGAIPMLERGTVAGIEAARLDARIAARAAAQARRGERGAEGALERAQGAGAGGSPSRAATVGTRLATPLAAARREATTPLVELGERLDAATEAAKTGYAHARDEQILLDASINTGKVDDPLVAGMMADTIRPNPEGFAEATRRVSLPETLARSADYMGMDVAELQKETARRGFTAGENAAFLVGIQSTLARLGGEIHTIAASSADDVAYAAAEGRFLSFARSVGGAASEAGRSMNALRLQRPMAFINAQYAKEMAKTAAQRVERAAKEVENANRAGRSAAQIAKHEQTLRDAQAAYEAAVERARVLGEQARTAAIIAADRNRGGAAARRYIATLDPNDIDSIIATLRATMHPSLADQVESVANVPRTLMATLDFSAPLRQGIVLSAAHPLSFARAFGVMVAATAKESRANRMLNELLVGPGSARRRAAGLELTDYRSDVMSAREEAFMTKALNNVPVLGGGAQAANRAYTMFLNKLRADVFDNAVAAWDRAGVLNRPNEEKGLATFINWASGRGTLPGHLESAAPLLNSLFFAPRFMLSRLETPFAPVVLRLRGQNEAAKLAAADLTKFVGAGLSVLMLAKLSGAQVEADPRSASFGKIATGPHLIDIWGGFQPNARYTAQIISGQTKAQDTRILDMGTEFSQTTRGDVLMRYLRTKLGPLPGLGMSALIGTDPSGEPTTVEGSLRETTPLGWQDVVAAWKADKDNSIRAAVVSSLALLGAGVRSDDPSAERTQVAAAKRQRMEALVTTQAYQTASSEEQKKMADRNVAEAGRIATLTYNIGVIRNGNPAEVVPAATEAMKIAGDNLRTSGVVAAVRQSGKLTPDVEAALNALRKQTDRGLENYDPTVAEYLEMNVLGAKWLTAPEFRRGTKAEWDAAALAASRLRALIAYEKNIGKDPSKNRDIRDFYNTAAGGTLRRFYERDGSKRSDLISRERRDIEKSPLWPLLRSSAARSDHPTVR